MCVKQEFAVDNNRKFIYFLWESQSKNAGTIIFSTGLGMRISYYHNFIDHLNTLGFRVIGYDYRGNGSRSENNSSIGLEALSSDLIRLYQHIHTVYPQGPITFVGHSLGGLIQLLAQDTMPIKTTRIINITTGTTYIKVFSGMQKKRTLLHLFIIRFTVKLLGYWPGRLVKFGFDESKQLMLDWSSAWMSGNYTTSTSKPNFKNLTSKVDFIWMKTDRFCPEKAQSYWTKKLHLASVTHTTIDNEEYGINQKNSHNGWINIPSIPQHISNIIHETY